MELAKPALDIDLGEFFWPVILHNRPTLYAIRIAPS